jgi:DNA-binding XRE family transcriptional regulator
MNIIEGQWRAARALIGWSQGDLANRVGVSVITIKRLEGSEGSVSAEIRDRAKAALAAAGIEFMNGARPGVRMKGGLSMSRLEFISTMKAYERPHLSAKGVHVPTISAPTFSFVFVYRDNDAVDLMLGAKKIGEANWTDGEVFLDPSVDKRHVELTQGCLDEWVAAAYARGLATP